MGISVKAIITFPIFTCFATSFFPPEVITAKDDNACCVSEDLARKLGKEAPKHIKAFIEKGKMGAGLTRRI